MELPKKLECSSNGHQKGGGGNNNIRENMCGAKNNHCVMRKQSWAASGASRGYMQGGGAEIPLEVLDIRM